MSDSYAVIGNPVAHSQSPRIHAAFAAQTSQDIVYTKVFCEPGAFAATVGAFRERGGKGMNVTLPFKHEACQLATRLSARAQAAGAANTLIFDAQGAGINADNTDGVGLVRDITENLRVTLRGKRLLLLGAGGASYGVAGPLLEAAPRALVVVNRTDSKAQALVQHFAAGAANCALSSCSYDALKNHGEGFDLVINATSAGLTGDMPDLPGGVFNNGALAYDMVYGKETPFITFARKCGVTVADGLGMLVEQAAESFYIWRGVRPRTAPVMEMMRREATIS